LVFLLNYIDPIFPYGIPALVVDDLDIAIEVDWIELCKDYMVYGPVNSKLIMLWHPDIAYLA